MNDKVCERCKWFKMSIVFGCEGYCFRFPEWATIERADFHYCGEWKDKTMISREEAIQILDNERPHCGEKVTYSEGEKCEAYDMAIEALSQPERPKGQWDKPSLYGLNGKLNDLGVIRSHCLKYADTDYDYCQNCGADMRGEEE